ncbi:MAG: PorT family protein [Candidatus Eisenbacteria sp.]|nr:PorT family protein [Candidatus Eisenbacteria bacterium]
MSTWRGFQGLVLGICLHLLTYVSPAIAQQQTSAADARLLISCRGGPSLGRVASDVAGEKDYRLAFEAGLSATYRLSRRYSVDLGVEYLSRGGVERYDKYSSNGNLIGEIEDTWEINYIGLPICARYMLSLQSLRPYLLLGAEPGFLLDATMERKVPVTVEYSRNPRRYDSTDLFRSFSLGIRVGGGLMMSLGSLAVSAEACYIHGVLAIFDDTHLKIHAITVCVGVGIPLLRS